MKVIKYLPILAICCMATGCNSRKRPYLRPALTLPTLIQLPCRAPVLSVCLWRMDEKPSSDRDEYSRFGSFDMLAENNRQQLRGLIEGLAAEKHEAGSIAQKVGELYNIAMDSVKLNKEGAAPIKPELEKIGAIKDKAEIYPLIVEMQKEGCIRTSFCMSVLMT